MEGLRRWQQRLIPYEHLLYGLRIYVAMGISLNPQNPVVHAPKGWSRRIPSSDQRLTNLDS